MFALFLLGAGPAAFLSERFDRGTRVALMPVLGLCVGVAATDTLVQWAAVRSTYWVIIVLAALSVGVAVLTNRRRRLLPRLRDLAQIAVVAILVVAPATYTLHQRSTVGPVSYNVYDASGYVSETDSEQMRSIEAASSTRGPYRNLAQELWSGYSSGYQNTDVSALEGSLNDILGLGSTDTQSPFMIALVLVGALGALAALRYLTDSDSWAGVLAAWLYGGGAVMMELWGDSSQAAICGLALLLPYVILGLAAARGRRVGDCALLALVIAGMMSVYPLFVPMVAVASVLVLGVLIVQSARRRRPRRSEAARASAKVAFTIALAAALTPIAFGRDLRYWRTVLHGGGPLFALLPTYHLPAGIVPSWLLQTRMFYSVASVGAASASQLVVLVLVPAVMLVVIAVGLRRWRRALVLVPFAVVTAALAEYVAVHNGCSYCAQRNLLPLAPMAAVAAAVGVATLVARAGWPSRLIGLAVVVIIAVSVGASLRSEHRQVVNSSFFLDTADRAVLSHLPSGPYGVELEGFNENLRGAGELPLVYNLVNERTGGRASTVVDSSDYSSFAYFGAPVQPAALGPGYHYVLTRFAGVRTDRRVIARSGGIALEERRGPLDVTPVAGLGTPLARLDGSGSAWLQGSLLPDPLTLVVTGARTGAPAWVRLELSTDEPVSVPAQPGVRYRRSGADLSVCLRAAGRFPTRSATLRLSFKPILAPYPPQPDALPQPAEGVKLDAMSATQRGCVP